MRKLLAALIFAASLYGQQPGPQPASQIIYGAVLPAACNPALGQVYFLVGPPSSVYQCLTSNTWAVMGGSAVLNITSPDGSIIIGGSASAPTLQVSATQEPGYSGNQVLSGCAVEWVSALIFNVGVCSYTINGVVYTTSAITAVTLSTADPSNPRVDVIIVNTSSTATKVTGTAAASPAAPTIDPTTQLALTHVNVAALATTPTGVSTVSIYEENTEWTSSVTSNFNAASTSNPYRGTKDIEATTAVLTNAVTLVKPAAGTEVLTNWNNLVFYLRSKATWPTGTGASAARSLLVYWLNGSTQVGGQIAIRSGTFGFDSSITSVYQEISIPISLFNTAGASVTSLKFQIGGNGGSTSIGFYIDAVSLQGGFGSPMLPTTLMNFRGTWASTAAYVPNDTVVSSNGSGYVAILASTNVALTDTTYWGSLTPREIVVELPVVDFATDITTGDGKYYFAIPSKLNGYVLTSVAGYVINVGTTNTTDIQLARCATTATGNQCSGTVSDMLSTKLTIDSNENKSSTATPPVINTSNDDVATDQVIRVDIDAVSTTAPKGLIIKLGFQLP